MHTCNTETLHMRTIAISINKGGQGKTALAEILATAATLAGLNVLLLDMDSQENATSWGERRKKRQNKRLPVVKFVTEHSVGDELKRAESAGCDVAFIDTPPGRSSEAPAAVELADTVLIPFWNDQDSYDGVKKTAGLARRLGKPAFAILNFATPNSRIHEMEALEVLQTIPLTMASVVLHRYEVHKDAKIVGLTAQEMEPDSIAAREIKMLWDWVRAILQIGTGAQVHTGTGTDG